MTGVAEQEAPGEGVGSGVGEVVSLEPPQAERQARAAAAAFRHALAPKCPGVSLANLRPPHCFGQDPELAHREVGEVAEEGGRVLLVEVVADPLQDPAEREEPGRGPG